MEQPTKKPEIPELPPNIGVPETRPTPNENPTIVPPVPEPEIVPGTEPQQPDLPPEMPGQVSR